MSRIKINIAAFIMASLPALALAQATPATPATPGIDKRQANQERRIQQGVNSGQLTGREAARGSLSDALPTQDCRATTTRSAQTVTATHQ